MIRRPRYPLALRLAWMDKELADAARLMQLLVVDVLAARGQLDDAESRIAILAGLVATSLLPLGIDPDLLDLLMTEMDPSGDVDAAEDVAADVMMQITLLLAPDPGETH